MDLAFFFGLWMHEFQEMFRSYDASGHFDIYKVPMACPESSKPCSQTHVMASDEGPLPAISRAEDPRGLCS